MLQLHFHWSFVQLLPTSTLLPTYIKIMYVCTLYFFTISNTINLWKGLLIIYYTTKNTTQYSSTIPYCLPYVILMFSFTQHIGTIIMISTLVKHYIGKNNLEMKLANKLPFSLVNKARYPAASFVWLSKKEARLWA